MLIKMENAIRQICLVRHLIPIKAEIVLFQISSPVRFQFQCNFFPISASSITSENNPTNKLG